MPVSYFVPQILKVMQIADTIHAYIQPGTVIRVKLDKSLVSSRFDKSFKSLFNNGYKAYNSTVKWCNKLDDDQSVSSFGIGVELS